MKKLTLFLMALTVVCGGVDAGEVAPAAPAPSTELRIAVCLKTLNSPFWQTVLAGATQAGKELGVKILALGPPTEDDAGIQSKQFDDVVKQKFDAIVFSPCKPALQVETANRAQDIPVVIIDTPMPENYTAGVTYIGSNNRLIGENAAREMLTVLRTGDKVLLLEGNPNNSSMSERADGAEAVLRAAGIEIVGREHAYSDRRQAYEITVRKLRETPIDGIFSANDDQALGAAKAAAEENKKVAIVGVDGHPSAKIAVNRGELLATIEQSAYQIGYLGVKNAVAYLRGERNIPKRIDAPAEVYRGTGK
ncbi:ABC transporter substrate-binding protein [Planctomycetales bacterium]|nr:ABC transporter substrate-binding protein [Planctomycetales bacterium]GHS99670.1 ABC transporter substrate-binding protein [Planctomycetales bacterium]GHT06650.1 ABC transporter substrate-binding protein [Planctomycetales bacterium]